MARQGLTLTQCIAPGSTVLVMPGDHLTLVLPDGTNLNLEQTADDFSLTKADGIVAYTKATSDSAKAHDGDVETVTGRN